MQVRLVLWTLPGERCVVDVGGFHEAEGVTLEDLLEFGFEIAPAAPGDEAPEGAP
jgi:hypothetical protein